MTANSPAQEKRRREGRAQWFVVLVLFAFGAGGWNYYQSYRADLESHRDLPFAIYSTPELRLLEEAYANESARAHALYEKRQGPARERPGGGAQDQRLTSRVANLERIQAATRKMRDAQADFAENEARLREVEAELARRSQPLAGLRVHLERLLRRNDS